MQTAFAFVVCALLSVSIVSIDGSRRYCQTNDDCKGENECCVKAEGLLLKKGICSEPTAEDLLCDPDAEKHSEESFYPFACPCVEGLSCQEREVTWGTTKYTIYKCVS